MAGIGEQGRRLRTREIPAPPQPPVTRSAVAGASHAFSQNENARRAKAPAKRAAMDESSNNRVANSGPIQQAKKRAALANLSNYCNVPSSRNGAASSKTVSQATAAKCKTRAAIAKEAEAQQASTLTALQKNAGKAAGDQNQFRIPSDNVSLPLYTDENAFLGKMPVPYKVKAEDTSDIVFQDVDKAGAKQNEVIASLERKKLHNLYISKDTNARAKQGYLFDGCHADEQGLASKNFTDIDSDHKDPQMCSSYATDIYHHLRMGELKRRPSMGFMDSIQQDINAGMRGILVDWLVEVAEEYKLVPDTLYLTVSYIDRYLSGNEVTRQRLQLLGVSCMLIAAKYEEICAPQVEEFCYITDNTYCREEVLEMERRVLNHLRFELTGPTTKSFLRRFIRAAQAGMKTPTLQLEFLGNYLAELTLVEYSFLKYLPSMIASSAVFMAKVTIDPTMKPWNATLQHYTGYRPSELRACAKAIHDLQRNTKFCTLPAIREKYRQHKFKCVASLPPPLAIPGEFFEDLDTQLSPV
eukprot:c19588_g2_i2 orf=163-1740(+)